MNAQTLNPSYTHDTLLEHLMKITMKTLIAAPLLIFAACGTPASNDQGVDCGEAESFESNGNTYCVASRAIIEKGFNCPPDMFDLNFGEVTVCSPNEQVPVPDQGPLYEYAQDQGGTGDPLQVCQTPDPSADDCATDADCSEGESCVEGDPALDCRSSSCFCNAASGTWGCSTDCQPTLICTSAASTECESDANCAADEVCAQGQCSVSPEQCTVDADCAQDQTCVNGACEFTGAAVCQDDADCPSGQVCSQGFCDG